MMENDRFVILIDDKRIVVIDKTKVRKILDEHIAPFPKIFNVSQHSPLWKKRGHGKSVRGLYFGGPVDADRKCVDESMIWIKHDAVDSADKLRSYIIHELRHWWQHANAERYAHFCPKEGVALNRTRRLLKFVGAACVVGALLELVLAGLGLWAIFVAGLALVVYTCLFHLTSSPMEKNPIERDAYGYVDEHGSDPEWKEAVFIVQNDELDQLRQAADKIGKAFGLQKLKSDP